MNFEYSDRAREVRDAVADFMEEHVYPNEEAMLAQIEEGERFAPIPLLETLKHKAKSEGLWNLFLPESEHGAGLSNLEYAPACEEMGRSAFAPEVFNCSAPDTGNMEVLVRYGTEAQKEDWLTPLLAGEIRSAFAMTEPDVASSDATNVAIRIEREGDNYVINGRKWWTSGALDPRCRILIVMGKTDPGNESRYRQQSMILVPLPWPGLTVKRMLPVFGFDDAPHGHAELVFEDVRVPVANILLGEGRGFEIAQGRLGPGRIHHCMRAIGAAERALERVCRRARMRTTFGVSLADQGVTRERIADMRIEIEQARLLTLKAAYMMDTVGNKAARRGDRDDQGRGAEHGLPGARHGDPGLRRGRRHLRLRACRRLCPRPHPSPRGRAGRGASQPDRAPRAQAVRQHRQQARRQRLRHAVGRAERRVRAPTAFCGVTSTRCNRGGASGNRSGTRVMTGLPRKRGQHPCSGEAGEAP